MTLNSDRRRERAQRPACAGAPCRSEGRRGDGFGCETPVTCTDVPGIAPRASLKSESKTEEVVVCPYCRLGQGDYE